MSEANIVYSIDMDDIQTVASEEFGRELTPEEIEKTADILGKYISWYDVTRDAIEDMLNNDR